MTVQERRAERRHQLLECAEAVANFAEHREIEPVHARHVKYDLEIRRVLDTVVRRWTRLVPTRFVSTAAAKPRGAKLHREHIVPSRVLVDRMIMKPSECRVLLEKAVIIADVTPEEHRRLGGIYITFRDLYERMLKAQVSELFDLGMERYSRKNIEVRELPQSAAARQ